MEHIFKNAFDYLRSDVLKIESIAKYSEDYKGNLVYYGTCYCTVAVDFDFAINCPDMENRVYYNKKATEVVKKRINELGVYILFLYDNTTKDIKNITVKYNTGCMVEYEKQEYIEKIVKMLIDFKEGETEIGKRKE